MSTEEVPPFERCGNTNFWKPVGQTSDDLRVSFVDPVNMIVITTAPQSESHQLLLRGWFEEYYPTLFDELNSKLSKKESEALSLWIETIIESVPRMSKMEILRAFSQMHPESQRLLISGILHWLTQAPTGWKAERREIGASDLPGLWRLLNSAGIHEC